MYIIYTSGTLDWLGKISQTREGEEIIEWSLD